MNTPMNDTMPQFNIGSGQAQLVLTGALNPCDQVGDLLSGAVRAHGINLNLLSLPVEEIFFRFTHHQEWALSEMSFAKYMALTAQGGAPMVALPVFTSRMFRHSAIYVRRDSGIQSPADLQGKTVGIPEWAQTAGVYVRGMLAEHHGVDLRTIKWVQAGVNQPGRQEKVALKLPAGIAYESRQHASLDQMLQSGEIDAAITARPVNAFLAKHPDLGRLFPNFREEELAYFRATGIFPIMHLVVLRRTDFEANRWIAMNLFKAFDRAKRRSVERLRDITASSVPLPWAPALAHEFENDFGEDLWPYGIEPNRKTLEAFCRFTFDQGVACRRVAVDELFPPEVHHSFRV